jgi:hypothetical protein
MTLLHLITLDRFDAGATPRVTLWDLSHGSEGRESYENQWPAGLLGLPAVVEHSPPPAEAISADIAKLQVDELDVGKAKTRFLWAFSGWLDGGR